MIKILSTSPFVVESLNECILQPQSEIEKVRQYLWENNLRVEAENMVEEEGKYYPMMRVVQGEDEKYSAVELKYGRCLINTQNTTLKKFLQKERREKEDLLDTLSLHQGTNITKRQKEIARELEQIKEALGRM